MSGRGLTPRLPMVFDDPAGVAPSAARRIVVCGVPGTGKSTLADGSGRRLGVPGFAGDWMMGALTAFGGRSDDTEHRRRLEGRSRGTAGWHDGGRWDVVKPRKDAFSAWDGVQALEFDAVDDPADNLETALRCLAPA